MTSPTVVPVAVLTQKAPMPLMTTTVLTLVIGLPRRIQAAIYIGLHQREVQLSSPVAVVIVNVAYLSFSWLLLKGSQSVLSRPGTAIQHHLHQPFTVRRGHFMGHFQQHVDGIFHTSVWRQLLDFQQPWSCLVFHQEDYRRNCTSRWRVSTFRGLKSNHICCFGIILLGRAISLGFVFLFMCQALELCIPSTVYSTCSFDNLENC